LILAQKVGSRATPDLANDPGVFCEQAFNTFFPIYE